MNINFKNIVLLYFVFFLNVVIGFANDFPFEIVNYSGKVEVSVVALDKTEAGLEGDERPGFWVGLKNGGVVHVDGSGLTRNYDYDAGCRFVSAARIVSTSVTTAVLGNNGNLQFFNRKLNIFTRPVAKLVDDVVLAERYYYYLSGASLHYGVIPPDVDLVTPGPATAPSNQVMVAQPSEISLSAFSSSGVLSESFKGFGRMKLFKGPSGQVFLVGSRNVFEIGLQAPDSSAPSIIRSTFLSRSQILNLAFDGSKGLIEHGSGAFSLFESDDWDEVKIQRLSKVVIDSAFCANSRFWLSGEGFLKEFGPDLKPDNYVSIELPEGAIVNAVVGDGDNIVWLGLNNGMLYQYECESKYLSRVLPPRKEEFKSIESLAFNGKSLLIGAQKGLFLHSVEDKVVRSLPLKGAPVSRISAMKAISASSLSISDGNSIYILDISAEIWTNGVIDEPSDFVSTDRDGKLLILNKNRFSKWHIFPSRIEGRTKLDGASLRHCDFFDGLAFYSTETTAYRLSTKRLIAPSIIWRVAPMFKLGNSRRWQRETITAMTTDAYGVVIANNLGEVRRISRFQGDRGHLSYVSSPEKKNFVTALTNRGNKIFAAFNGPKSGIYSIEAHNDKLSSQNEWKLLYGLILKEERRITNLLIVGSWLVGRAEGRVYLVNLTNGKVEILDGSRGSYAGSCVSLTSYGKTLYLGGKGVTKIRME